MDSPRPTKRQRLSGTISPITPISPPESEETTPTTNNTSARLARALHVLQTEADALAHISHLYKTSPTAQLGLQNTISAILRAHAHGGKLITTGVGKSSYIAQKLTATCKSLGIPASFMHACEAAHGDLGDIHAARKDVVLFVSFSGKTPELLNLLPHVEGARDVTVVAMSSHLERGQCALLQGRDEERGILLPAPIPVREEVSFGVSAPTTSTTVALAVADMLALAVADEMHRGKTRDVFLRNHPGGAIGMTHREVEEVKKSKLENVSIVELPSPSISAESED